MMIAMPVLTVCYMLILFCKNRLLSTSSMWLLCYAVIFIACPLIDPQPDIPKVVTYYSFAGLISFIFGNFIIFLCQREKVLIADSISKKSLSFFDKKPSYANIKSYRSLIFLICLVALVLVFSASGISAIINGKFTTSDIINGTPTESLGGGNFISTVYNFFGIFLIICSMFIVASFIVAPDNKKSFRSNTLWFLAFAAVTVLFSYARRFLIYTFVSILIFYLMKKSKGKKLIYSFLCILFLCIAMILLAYVRCYGIKAIFTNFVSTISQSPDIKRTVLDSLDFEAAYVYFGKLVGFGEIHVSPLVYFKPFLILIPRTIWAAKPEAFTVQVMEIIDPQLASSGFSAGMSVLGEAHVMLGMAGAFIFSFLWGIFCAKYDLNYLERVKKYGHGTYGEVCYYIVLVEFIIEAQRGGTGAIMDYLWFYLIPLFLSSVIIIKRRKAKCNSTNKSAYTTDHNGLKPLDINLDVKG